MSWWRDDDVFRARSADTFDLKATDGPSTQSTGAHLSEERSRNVEEKTETGGISWTCCCPYMSPILIQILIIFVFKTLRRIPFSLCTEDVWAGSQKAFLLFAESLLLRGGSSFGKCKTHTSSFLLRTDNTLLSFQPPQKKTPRRNLVRCATSLMTLIHMIMRILSVDFSFYTGAALRSSGVASHVNTCIPLRHPDSAACWC